MNEIVTAEIDRLSGRISNPVPGPNAVLFHRHFAGDPDRRIECWRLKVVVKLPAIGDYMGFFAARAPMGMPAGGLTHQHRF